MRSESAFSSIRSRIALGAALLLSSLVGCATERLTERESRPARPYVFAWPDYADERVQLRGGTSTGAPVELARDPGPAWQALHVEGLSRVERDQAAIRALAGDYRTSFDFLETMVFAEGVDPATPYRSWGTERVFVLEDRPGFLSLQHVMVMFVVDEAGEPRGPFVQKHWRQDWTFEPTSVLEFRGFARYRSRPLSASERAGRWTQTVYQVDDTPRFTLIGEWSHNERYSVFTSSPDDWRPLPRREHTVRDDYQAIAGTNRITVHPTGWVHEQDNLKLVLTGPGVVDADAPARAREIGVNRYDRILDFDFTAGAEYWEATAPFWSDVRSAWRDRIARGSEHQIANRCGEQPAFQLLFMMAEESRGTPADSGERRAAIEETLDCLHKVGAATAL